MLNPLIVLGAPRSGTNALRNTICNIKGFETWPCDEINYAWRFSNSSFKYDNLSASQASTSAKNYIRKLFYRLYEKSLADVVVEKTCANCLRVPFVAEIFPGAKYLYIRRDPYDVVSSSLKRWEAPLDIPYLLKKLIYIPKADIPYYATKYLIHRLKKISYSSNALPSWGPRFAGIDELRKQCSLPELCVHQWYECCFSAETDLLRLSSSGSPCYFLNYNDFVTSPKHSLSKALKFLGFEVNKKDLLQAATSIHRSSIGKGRTEMSPQMLNSILAVLSCKSPLPLDSVLGTSF